MTYEVVVWNMAHKKRNWQVLDELDVDIALLTEAPAVPEGHATVGVERTEGRDSYKRAWAARVVSRHPLREIDDAVANRFGQAIRIPFDSARPGSWASATVTLPTAPPVTAISLYGLLDEKSDASVHRSLSDLTPLFEDKRYNSRIVLGGDLNTWTGWSGGSRHLARDQSVLSRIRAFGFVDCLERGLDRAGPLPGCTCSLDDCRHSWTRLDPKQPEKRYQMDYLFASPALAEQLESCEALPPDEWRVSSDHAPIRASFAG